MKNKIKQKVAIKKIKARAKREQDKLLKNAKKLKARLMKVDKKLMGLTKSAKAAKKAAQKREKKLIKSLKKVKAVAVKEKDKLSKKLKAKAQKVKQLRLQMQPDEEVESIAIEKTPIPAPKATNITTEVSATKVVEEA